jgi:hypothetical protein
MYLKKQSSVPARLRQVIMSGVSDVDHVAKLLDPYPADGRVWVRRLSGIIWNKR